MSESPAIYFCWSVALCLSESLVVVGTWVRVLRLKVFLAGKVTESPLMLFVLVVSLSTTRPWTSSCPSSCPWP